MANSREEESFYEKSGWRSQPMLRSLSEVHRTLVVPHPARFYRKLLAFAGPGFLVAVGYMDPGNWATDLAGGSKFNYTLLSVIMISNFMAILLQSLSLKLGIAMKFEIMMTESRDRKSTRLNSSHLVISYAVFCLKKKNYN